MSLKELHIQNFKFFREVEQDSPLSKIDGRHVLIYGENGSGKSTIYWALYTLLEASFKENDDEIKKYFDRRRRENLVNIHSSSGDKSFVKALIKNEEGSEVEYKVSSRDLAIRGDSDVMESNMASDFINYRILFQLHNLKHSKENDLFAWFEEEVLPYVKIKGAYLLNGYEQLIKGPKKFINEEGQEVFPSADMRGSDNQVEAHQYQYYKSYIKDLNGWCELLEEFLSIVFLGANSILKEKFHHHFQIGYEFEKARVNFEKNNTELVFTPPKILLRITEYEGIQNPKISKPHTFLNEAKWSAIGLALRLAVLDFKLDKADLNCLIIDDMMLSLDMSNRDVVTKTLLDDYAHEYQIIFMTHDMSYFIWMKHELESRGKFNDESWMALEMYVDEEEGHEKPIILKSENELAVAYKHFKNHDYAASANYLRKHAERILCDWLPEYCWINPEKADHSKNKMPLQNIIEAGIKFLGRIYQPTNHYKELKKYVSILLNPLSHVDVGVSRYKVEIENIITLLKEIEKFHSTIKYRPLLAGGEELQIQLPKPSTNQIYTYSFELKDSIFEVKSAGKTRISTCKMDLIAFYPIEKDRSVVITNKREFDYVNKELFEAYETICNYDAEFVKQGDIRPFLFDRNGNNI